MIILGVDPGIALTGWGVVERKDDPVLIDFGCIKTSKNTESSKRLFYLYTEFKKILKKYRPAVVSLEKLFFNTNAKTAFSIGEARGVLKTCCAINQVPFYEFTPLQIKNAIVGYGRADKNQVQQMVKILLNLKQIPKPDDAADGLAAALTYCCYHKNINILS